MTLASWERCLTPGCTGGLASHPLRGGFPFPCTDAGCGCKAFAPAGEREVPPDVILEMMGMIEVPHNQGRLL